MERLILLIILFAPMVAALVVAMGGPCRRAALWSGAVQVLLTIYLWGLLPMAGTGYAFVTSVPMMSLSEFFTINFTIGLDGINTPLLLLTSVVGLAAVAIVPRDIRREREFHVLLLLIILGATGAFVSLDLFFLYIFHEVALIPTFLMIGIWGSRDRKLAATQMTLYLAAGSLVLLAGLLCFYFAFPSADRSLDLREIEASVAALGGMDGNSQAGVFLLLLVGFGTLVSLFPFHSWAPLGYASAPAPVAMLHAGVLKKFGIYGLLRLASPFLPEGIAQWSLVLQVLILGNILYIGWVTIAQKELDLMIGYSSVMHMGYLFLGLLGASFIGLSGVVVLMVGHGLSAALLFGLTAEIRDRVGVLKFSELGGLARKAPRLSLLFIVGAFASIGLPGLANFPGELLIFFGTWGAYPVATGVAIFGVVLSAVYMLRAVATVFFGPISEAVSKTEDLSPGTLRWPYAMLAGGLLLFGFFPRLITDLVGPVLGRVLAG